MKTEPLTLSPTLTLTPTGEATASLEKLCTMLNQPASIDYFSEEQSSAISQTIAFIQNDLIRIKEIEKQSFIEFHIDVMKAGLINEGEQKWKEEYLPKIADIATRCFAEKYERTSSVILPNKSPRKNTLKKAKKPTQWDKGFTQGYMCACSTIVQEHGSETEVIDALKGMYSSVDDLRSLEVEEYDLEVLLPLFKEIDRKRSMDMQ